MDELDKIKSNVVHCKRARFDTYIGRPSKWANRFVIGKDGTRDEVIAKYKQWLMQQPELLAAAREELAGKVLGCWCRPQHRCHGDVLAEIANAAQEPLPRVWARKPTNFSRGMNGYPQHSLSCRHAQDTVKWS
jgi:hypothetical protein